MGQDRYRVKVVRISRLAQGVVELVLESENQELLPGFSPGAHVDVHLPNAMVRAYSLTHESDPDGALQYVIAVGLSDSSRGGSRFIHEAVQEEDRLEVGAPRNLFPMVDDDAPALFIAGGIGITPLRAMARQRHARGQPWRLVYAARSRDHAAYADELAAMGARVQFHFDDQAGRPLDVDKVLTGLTPETHVYCCGPQALMDKVRQLAGGHPTSHLHFESFGQQLHTVTDAPERAFLVELSRKGITVEVPHGQSIIDCLESHGIVVPSVCREGHCGACESTVLGGEIDHRDQILSEAEKQAGKTMMICVSRARGDRLVLDV